MLAMLRRERPIEVVEEPDAGELARELVARGGPYSDEDRRTFAAALPLLLNRGVIDGLDVLSIVVAREQAARVIVPILPKLDPPPALAERLAGAEADEAEKMAALTEARSRYFEALDAHKAAINRAVARGQDVDRGAVSQRAEAEENMRRAESAWTRSRARVIALEQAVSRWRASQL
jgi:hypothetical protein